jgi:hypothetical protein
MESESSDAAPVGANADVWRERIEAQRASGQSIRAWCRENSHHEHAFYSWRGRLGLSPAPARKRRSRQDGGFGFAEVVVGRGGVAASPVVASLAEPILLRFAGGRELVLPVSMPVRQIAGLVHELEGAQ